MLRCGFLVDDSFKPEVSVEQRPASKRRRGGDGGAIISRFTLSTQPAEGGKQV